MSSKTARSAPSAPESAPPEPRPPKVPIPPMTREEWVAEGTKRFGPDMMHWRFVCPGCGHVQTPADFIPYKERVKSPDAAYLYCIGRLLMADEQVHRAFGVKHKGDPDTPCDYTSGGLFNINPVPVEHEGTTTWAFAFAEPLPAEEVKKHEDDLSLLKAIGIVGGSPSTDARTPRHRRSAVLAIKRGAGSHSLPD